MLGLVSFTGRVGGVKFFFSSHVAWELGYAKLYQGVRGWWTGSVVLWSTWAWVSSVGRAFRVIHKWYHSFVHKDAIFSGPGDPGRGPRIEDPGPRTRDRGPRTEDPGPRTRDRGPGDPGTRIGIHYMCTYMCV